VIVAFYRGRWSPGWPWVVTDGINGFNATEGCARLRGVKVGP
jgi:hypothetical protein